MPADAAPGPGPAPGPASGPASKVIRLGGQSLTIFAPSAEDHYFTHVADELDPEFTGFVARNVAPNAICMDLGANIGIKTVQLARLAPAGRVVAVEAGPRLHACLRETIRVNGVSNAAADHAAVTGRDGGTVRFAENSAYGQISADGVDVPSATLAGIADRHALPRVDFVKMDLEGFEFPVLRSSLPVFVRDGTVVCFEFNSWCMLGFTEDHPRHCLEWLLTTFPEVYALRRNNPPDSRLQRFLPGTARDLLATNMVHDGLVTDLVACMAPGRVRV